MLYTGCLFNQEQWLGKPMAVSRSLPNSVSFSKSNQWDFLAPSKELLSEWKKREKLHKNDSDRRLADWRWYGDQYSGEIALNWKKVKRWLDGLKPENPYTILCWEKSPTFCHRSLIGKLVQQYRPDCWWENGQFSDEDCDQEKKLREYAVFIPELKIGAVSVKNDDGKIIASLPAIAFPNQDPYYYSWNGAFVACQQYLQKTQSA